jgi:hypothetical protein
MFKLYFLTSVADVVASVTLNCQLIRNSLEFESFFFFFLITLKNWFYKGIGALVLHLGLVRQINPYELQN